MRPSVAVGVMGWLLPCSAVAVGLPEQLLPTPEPTDIFEVYREFAKEKGRSGAAAVPACRQLAESLMLCYSFEAEGVRRLATEQELIDWDVAPTDLEARARVSSAGAFGRGRPVVQMVEGMPGRFWVANKGDGLDAAGLLHPDKLAEIAGAPPVVGMPDRNTLIFWVPGDVDFDKVLAVGVLRMFEASEHPVSKLVYRWDGEKWVVWGEVRAGG